MYHSGKYVIKTILVLQKICANFYEEDLSRTGLQTTEHPSLLIFVGILCEISALRAPTCAWTVHTQLLLNTAQSLGLVSLQLRNRIFLLVLLWILNSPLMLCSILTTIQCSTPRGQRFKPTIFMQHQREAAFKHQDTKPTHRGHSSVWLRTESLTNLELCLAAFQHLSMPGG